MRKFIDFIVVMDEKIFYEIVVADKPSDKGIDGGKITTAHIGMKSYELCSFKNGEWLLSPENSIYPAFAKRAIKMLKEKYDA